MENCEFQVSRIHRIDGDSKLKAFADVTFGGIVIEGLRVVEGKEGLFVGMPRHQAKDGKWYDTIYPASKEIRQKLSDLVLAAYQE